LTGYQISLEDEYHHSTGFCKFETETGVLLLQAQKIYTRISAVACEHVSGQKY
jgi:hypothetical protein